VLGPADAYRVVVAGTSAAGDQVGPLEIGLDQLGRCALDAVVESRRGPGDSVSPLERRLAAAIGAVDGTVVAGVDHRSASSDGSWDRLLTLADGVATVLTSARPALPADLAPPPTSTTPETAPPALNVTALADLAGNLLGSLDDAIKTVDDDVATLGDGEPVGDELLVTFADLTLAGAIAPAGAATAGRARAAASSGRRLRDEVDQLVAGAEAAWQAADHQPGPAQTRAAHGRQRAATVWTSRLNALAARPRGFEVVLAVVARIGGAAVLPAPPVASQLEPHMLPDGAAPSVADLESWVEVIGRARDRFGAYDDIRLFTEAAGRSTDRLRAAHLPLVAGQPWLGGPLTTEALDVLERPDGANGVERRATTHLVVSGDIAAGSGSALVLDEFDEVIPSRRATTGIAFHYDAPGARPPQSILVAAHPDPSGPWTWQLLDELVTETVDLARLRLVELEDLATIGLGSYLPLTYMRTTEPRPRLTWDAFPWPVILDATVATTDIDEPMEYDLYVFLTEGIMTPAFAAKLQLPNPYPCPEDLLDDLQATFQELLEARHPDEAALVSEFVSALGTPDAGELDEVSTKVESGDLTTDAVTQRGTEELIGTDHWRANRYTVLEQAGP
jgi:hypothetical protein